MNKPEIKPKTKPASTKYEGSRLGSLVLLAITILVSLVFYIAGR